MYRPIPQVLNPIRTLTLCDPETNVLGLECVPIAFSWHFWCRGTHCLLLHCMLHERNVLRGRHYVLLHNTTNVPKSVRFESRTCVQLSSVHSPNGQSLYLCMLVDKELAVTLESGTGNGAPRPLRKKSDARDSPAQPFFFPKDDQAVSIALPQHITCHPPSQFLWIQNRRLWSCSWMHGQIFHINPLIGLERSILIPPNWTGSSYPGEEDINIRGPIYNTLI